MADIETATISETAASNNAASPDGMPEGMAPSGVNDSWRENVAAQKRLFDRDHVTISSTGSDPTYVLTYLTAPTAYINGGKYAFRASFGNAGAASANVNGLGSKTINQHTSAGLAVLAGGEIKTAHHVTLEYDSTADVLVIVSPTPASSGFLGTIASQNANAVNITGGTITGITDLAVADGGTGRSTLTNHGVIVGAGTGGVNQVAPGTAGQVLTSNGPNADPTMQTAIVGAGTTYSNFVLLTSGTTWSVPAGVTQVLAVLQGGGGAGGGAVSASSGTPNSYGSSGSPGANIAALVAVSGSVTYSIGAGGTAGSSGNNPGNPGGDTTFGTVTAKGGLGGLGAASGATAASPGQPQAPGLTPISNVAIVSATLIPGTSASGADGPNSPFGPGGSGNAGGNGSAASAGFGGAGGAGGITSANSFNQHGGAGRIGCIVIFY